MTEDLRTPAVLTASGILASWGRAETRLPGEGRNDAVGRSVVIKRRTIEVVVVVVGLVFLFGFLAVVILSLFLGIG